MTIEAVNPPDDDKMARRLARGNTAIWMQDEPGWVYLPDESKITEMIELIAGCGGLCFINTITAEVCLCDGSDIVLWSGKITT